MRVDKYLKVSRLIKRRTVANEACDGGRVSINGRTVKASAEVKPGDVLSVTFASGRSPWRSYPSTSTPPRRTRRPCTGRSDLTV